MEGPPRPAHITVASVCACQSEWVSEDTYKVGVGFLALSQKKIQEDLLIGILVNMFPQVRPQIATVPQFFLSPVKRTKSGLQPGLSQNHLQHNHPYILAIAEREEMFDASCIQIF